MLSGVSWTIFHRFLTCVMLSQSIKTTLNRIFSCQCCMQPLEQLCIGFWHLQCFPRVLRQHWTEFFPVQCCLEPLEQNYIGFFLCKGVPGVLKDNISQPLRQHCKGFWSVSCCPRSIKTTLHRIFSYAMMSGAHRTILHKRVIYSMFV